MDGFLHFLDVDSDDRRLLWVRRRIGSWSDDIDFASGYVSVLLYFKVCMSQ